MENLKTLDMEELELINAGGWKEAGCAFLGTAGLGLSLPIGVLALAGGF